MTLIGSDLEKIIKKDKIYRISAVFLLLLSLVTVVGIVFMLPSYFNVIYSKDEILRRLQTAEEVLARRESNKLEEETARVNDYISKFTANERKRHSFSDLLVSIFKVTPVEISIDSLNLLKNKDGRFVINITGNASTRSSLISYISDLQKLPALENVKSPISNLLEESNALFQLELSIKPEVYKL